MKITKTRVTRGWDIDAIYRDGERKTCMFPITRSKSRRTLLSWAVDVLRVFSCF